jgi:type IV secretory pathway VirB3-like protein
VPDEVGNLGKRSVIVGVTMAGMVVAVVVMMMVVVMAALPVMSLAGPNVTWTEDTGPQHPRRMDLVADADTERRAQPSEATARRARQHVPAAPESSQGIPARQDPPPSAKNR